MTAPALPQSILQDRRLYEVLCIDNFSSTDEVRVAYKALALKNHPDKNIGDPSAADRFREISRAYEVLANPEHKKRYDIALRVALASYDRSGGGGPGGLGANPYSVNPVSMSDIYKDLYKRQSERAATRTRTTSQPPKDPSKATSQYTKAQQELFKKREKERQQELKRQMEREKREQRERERAALRREQERQEELLQQRWQHQQQRGANARMATRSAAAAKRTNSTGTGSARYGATSSGSARGLDSSSRTVTPRANPSSTAAGSAEGGLSGRRTPVVAPNTVRLGTPARNGTPRVRRAGAATPSPGRRSNDRFHCTTPTTPTPTSMTKDEYDEEVNAEEEEHDGAAFTHGDGGAKRRSHQHNLHASTPQKQAGNGESGGVWYTPLTSPMGGSVHILHTSSGSRSSRSSSISSNVSSEVDELSIHEDEDGASSGNPRPNPSMGFTNARHSNSVNNSSVTAAAAASPSFPAGAEPTSVLHRSSFRPSTAGGTRAGSQHTNPRTSATAAREGTSSGRKAPVPAYTAQRRASNAAHTPSSGVAARTHSPRISTTTTATTTTTPRRTFTPRGQTTGYAARTTSPSASSPRTAAGTTVGSGRGATAAAARTTSPLPGSKGGSAAGSGGPSSPFLHRVRVTPGLAESDKELLEKQRRDRLAKEKDRQRLVRLAEEERQFKRAARILKQQKAADGAAAAAEAQLSTSELLAYVQADELSERQQFIEREEQLAWRRLQRQHITVLADTVFRKRFAALTMEELVRRNTISSAARQEGWRLGCAFQEWAGRCGVEWREGRDRRQLKGREAADSYHTQRLAQRWAALKAEESSQRAAMARGALLTLSAMHLEEAAWQGRVRVAALERADRFHLCTAFAETTELQRKRREDEALVAETGTTSPAARGESAAAVDLHDDDSSEWHTPRATSPLVAASMGAASASSQRHLNTTEASRNDDEGNNDSQKNVVHVVPVLFPSATATTVPPISYGGSAVLLRGSTESFHSLPSTHSSGVTAGGAGAAAHGFHAEAPADAANASNSDDTSNANRNTNNNNAGLSPDRRLLDAAAERRVQALLADETRQRSLLLSQQHHEEVALRRRRATALHRVFAKERDDAVKAAQRAAQAELRALQSEVRALQRQQQQQQQRSGASGVSNGAAGVAASSSAASTPPQNNSIASASVSPLRAVRTSLTASADTTPMKPSVVVTAVQPAHQHRQPLSHNGRCNDGSLDTSTTVGADVAPSPLAVRNSVVSAPALKSTTAAPTAPRRRVVSTPGWKTLPDSDVEDNH